MEPRGSLAEPAQRRKSAFPPLAYLAVPRRFVQSLAVVLCLLAGAAGILTQFCAAPDLATRLRDDAYYEFVWARNVSLGAGPTVSAGVTTSGVQLLWSCLLVPLAWLFGAQSLPLLAPWLGFCLHALTSWLWSTQARGWLRVGIAGLCFGHPLLLRECMNGQETALAGLCGYWLWRARKQRPRGFFLAALLATLARADLFVLAALLGWQRARLRGALALVALCYLLANQALGGGWLPDSAAPMAWLWHANFALTLPTLAEQFAQHWWYLRPVLLGGPFAMLSTVGIALLVVRAAAPFWPQRGWWLPLLAMPLLTALGLRDAQVLGMAALLLPVWLSTRRLPSGNAALLLGFALLVVALHWAVRWYPRDYYLAPLMLAVWANLPSLRRLPWLVACFALGQLADTLAFRGEDLHGQRAMALAGEFLHEVLPLEQRVGSFNSGLVTWGQAARSREVFNLDGVVDARALAALQERRLLAYLDDHGIAALLDNSRQLAMDPRQPHACGPWFAADFVAERDFVPSATFAVPEAEPMRLYVRRGSLVELVPWSQPVRWLGHDARSDFVLGYAAQPGVPLTLEMAAGERRVLAVAETSQRFVLALPRALAGTGRLFVGDAAQPALTLPRL